MPENIGLWILFGFIAVGCGMADRIAEKKRKRNRRLYVACDNMARAFESLALDGWLTGVRLEPLIEVAGLLEKKLWLEADELSVSVRAGKLVDMAAIQETSMYRRIKIERYCAKEDPMVNLLTEEELDVIEGRLESLPLPDQFKARGRMLKEAISSRPAFQA